MRIDATLTPAALQPAVHRTFALAVDKVARLDRAWDAARGTPVFTVAGAYTSRGWTEWTQGFQYGCALLAFDGTGDKKMLRLGRERTFALMTPHLTHTGVHDHGFNNLSTYGTLRRLILEGAIRNADGDLAYCELALKVSGAVQAARWAGTPPVPAGTPGEKDHIFIPGGPLGYIYSFNGPHSLFVDTMRTTRILGVAWKLGHVLMHENDKKADLLKRSVLHGLTTSRYIVYHGLGAAQGAPGVPGHPYDVAGRTCHEAVFNRNDGSFRTRATQQGYSPFSTWTRGLAWAMLGYAEELEFFATIPAAAFKQATGLDKTAVVKIYERCAKETCDHYINDVTALDGIPYWDDGAPGLAKLGDWRQRPADPFNDYEPVDSSAAAIAAQGLLRLGHYLGGTRGKRYTAAGLCVARTLFSDAYLATDRKHQGLIVHSVYHRPNHWDYIPQGRHVPCGESSLWGDYHALELALLLQRLAQRGAYPTFFGP